MSEIDWEKMTIDERVDLLRSSHKFVSVGECRRLASQSSEVIKRVVDKKGLFSGLEDYRDAWNDVIKKGAKLVELSLTYKEKLKALSSNTTEVEMICDLDIEIHRASHDLQSAQLHLIGLILSFQERSLFLLKHLDVDEFDVGELSNEGHDNPGILSTTESE